MTRIPVLVVRPIYDMVLFRKKFANLISISYIRYIENFHDENNVDHHPK